MESAVCVSGFLLLLFSTGVHLSPHPQLEFGVEGGDVGFDPSFSGVDDYVLYRVYGDEDLLLLINCSQPERPQPDGYEVKCDNNFNSVYFKMSKLTMSHSGDYRAEGWRGGNITEHKNYSLTVCADHHSTPYDLTSYDDHVELYHLNRSLGYWSNLQLYRYDRMLENYILLLDTNSSLEPLVEDLKGRLQVDLNSSSVTLAGVVEFDNIFCLTVWRGAQCQSYIFRKYIGIKRVVVYENETVTLPCIVKGEFHDQVFWTYPGRHRITINQTHPQEVMYMLNGSQTGDYSLIIPSVSLQHSGMYACTERNFHKSTFLFVCSKVSTLEVMFSPGQSVLLNTTEHVFNISMYGTQWLRQPQALIVEVLLNISTAPLSLPEDLRGRVTVSTSPSNSSLIISNLTAEDSGMYTWRFYGFEREKSAGFCSEGSFRLVYMDPLGVHSPFYRAYAPLIGCGLLGLVAAVIWLKLRSRRGEQTSGRQSREGQQSGDEDLNGDLVMSELNTPPSAVSDGAVEHSV